MKKSDVHEILANLYLRLNGYFTTGLILHSDEWGKARTDIDCLAIRHPHHIQAERALETAEFLGARTGELDVIICEVKSCRDQLAFNKPIRTDLEVTRAALRWVGIFEEGQVRSVADRLLPLFQDGVPADIARDGVIEGSCRVRPLLCCPPCDEDSIDTWCLVGAEIFRFADQCFNPPSPRSSCSTRYNFRQWGFSFAPIVQYLKEERKPKTIEDLYERLGAN